MNGAAQSTLNRYPSAFRTGLGFFVVLGLTFALLNLAFLAIELPRHYPRLAQWTAGGGILGPNRLAFEAVVLVAVLGLLAIARSRSIDATGRLFGATRSVRIAGGLAWGLAALGVLILLVLAVFDGVARVVLDRGLNLALDVPLLMSLWHLGRDNVGALATVVAAIAFSAGLVALAWGIVGGLEWVVRRGARVMAIWRPTSLGGVAVVFVAVLGFGLYGVWQSQVGPLWGLDRVSRAVSPVVHLVREQSTRFVMTRAEAAVFAEVLRGSHAVDVVPLTALQGRDFDVVFIESYGQSLLGDARWRDATLTVLDDWEARLSSAGWAMASTTVEAPIMGGQSWLAHATLLSGQPVTNQLRYEFLLRSPATTLLDDAQAAGYRTMAVMPAIVLPWPEGRWFAFDEIYEAGDLGYAGPPFHWVTMPDQFTLAALERLRAQSRRPGPVASLHGAHSNRLSVASDQWAAREGSNGASERQIARVPGREREPESDTPLMTVTALISSHAPWTPILPRLDWSEIDDEGAVFWRFDGLGETPEQLWRDLDRVREHYGDSVRYSLDVTLSLLEERVRDDRLVLVIGDHPAAPLVVGSSASRAVPLHVFSRDAALIDAFEASEAFSRGLRPPTLDHTAPGLLPMERLRFELHRRLAGEATR
ncbi:MAG: hypothetical protein ACK4IT_02175 [Thioalkalivibrionaceae bacterium]